MLVCFSSRMTNFNKIEPAGPESPIDPPNNKINNEFISFRQPIVHIPTDAGSNTLDRDASLNDSCNNHLLKQRAISVNDDAVMNIALLSIPGCIEFVCGLEWAPSSNSPTRPTYSTTIQNMINSIEILYPSYENPSDRSSLLNINHTILSENESSIIKSKARVTIQVYILYFLIFKIVRMILTRAVKTSNLPFSLRKVVKMMLFWRSFFFTRCS